MKEKNNSEIAALKVLAKGGVIFLIGLFLSKLISLVYRIIAAQFFGIETYGLFNIALAAVGMVTPIAMFGLHTAVTRFVAFYNAKNEKEKSAGTILFSLKFVAVLSVLFSIVLILASPFIAENVFNNSSLTLAFQIISISLPFTALSFVLFGVFNAFKRIELTALTQNIVLNFSKVVFVALFFFIAKDVIGLAWSFTLAAIATFVIAFYLMEAKVFSVLKRGVKAVKPRKELLVFSIPLVLINICTNIATYAGTLIIGLYRNAIQVGVFNAITPIAGTLALLPNAVCALFLPLVSESFAQKNKNRMKELFKTANRWIYASVLPIFLVLLFFPAASLGLLFGNDFVSGALALQVFIIGTIFSNFALTSVYLIATLKKTNIQLVISLVFGAFNLLFNFYLIGLFGVLGGAMAYTFSILIQSTLLIGYVFKKSGLQPFSWSILKSSLAGFAAILPVFFAASSLFNVIGWIELIAIITVFLLLYAVLLFWFRAIKKDDLEILKATNKKFGLHLDKIIGLMEKFI